MSSEKLFLVMTSNSEEERNLRYGDIAKEVLEITPEQFLSKEKALGKETRDRCYICGKFTDQYADDSKIVDGKLLCEGCDIEAGSAETKTIFVKNDLPSLIKLAKKQMKKITTNTMPYFKANWSKKVAKQRKLNKGYIKIEVLRGSKKLSEVGKNGK